MTEPLICIRGLRGPVGTRGLPEMAVEAADFERGALHLLMGGNGFGKSTLIRMLLGFKPFQRGTITWAFEGLGPRVLDGRTPLGALAELYQNVGYVPQGGGDSLWPDRTVREHVSLPLTLKSWKGCPGRGREARERYVERVLERALVAPAFWDRRPASRSAQGAASSMSGGERQRVAYARAISTDPETLVLDELEAALDETSRRQFVDSVVRDYLGTVGGPRRTALVVTHDPAAWVGLPDTGVTTVLWQFSRSVGGEITLRRELRERSVWQVSPAAVFLAQQEMLEGIGRYEVPGETGERWEGLSWQLCRVLLAFLEATLDAPAVILSVAAPDPVAPAAGGNPVLLAAAGPAGQVADGRDAGWLEPFVLKTVPATFPDVRVFTPAPGARVPLKTSLLSQLVGSGLDAPYKGFRVDSLELGGMLGECFCFTAEDLAGLGNTQSYIELSRGTRRVYLFRVVAQSGSNLAVALDFQEAAARLDPWQRFFILRALQRVLERVAVS